MNHGHGTPCQSGTETGPPSGLTTYFTAFTVLLHSYQGHVWSLIGLGFQFRVNLRFSSFDDSLNSAHIRTQTDQFSSGPHTSEARKRKACRLPWNEIQTVVCWIVLQHFHFRADVSYWFPTDRSARQTCAGKPNLTANSMVTVCQNARTSRVGSSIYVLAKP